MYAVGKPRRGGRTVCRPFLHGKRSPFGSSDYWANVTTPFSRGFAPACNLLPILGRGGSISRISVSAKLLFLYQTTTLDVIARSRVLLYLILFLYQTTTADGEEPIFEAEDDFFIFMLVY